MFEKLLLLWKISELRAKILFVLGMLAVFRLAASIPVAGVDTERLAAFFQSNQLFGLINIFTGGTLENLSIAMLGVGPYITATIILQLLTMIFPRLKEMYYEEGEQGRQKFNQIGRLLTVPLAILQGFGFLRLLASQGVVELTPITTAVNIAVVVAGTILLMWLGELITEKGIGNGVSLIIFAGIVASIPQSLFQFFSTWDQTKLFQTVAFAAIAIIVVAGVVLINEAQRRVPIAYAKRIRGFRMYGGVSTHLPIRVNSAGVIPIIFALSIVLFPGMIAQFFTTVDVPQIASIANTIQNIFSVNNWTSIFIYFGLVFIFTYFYTAVIFDPKEISQNIQRSGGFIPGIRPGSPMVSHLSRIINRTTLVGASFLGIIAVLPQVMQQGLNLPALTIGGTAVLIVVSVVIETMKQIEAQLTMREYEGF
ncbi:MAG: preprotein translocase subunit SecY [Candidatus Terrybacteria bacterium RIFCSPHIGHO2_01_FULL_48_17]|uniref:Protein translocase subunit SecY n=1 Tax=Candidatus Terrybacteria bacterium RIFCSPHIGHO2_01_FULL_48_17 TaxID=1802362 RepID=A0A1G2PKU6_9BACT|nr:MAG: preprotein translocase subunit SecY [Candidatus Terrybacteria bacterium RIFCSPHIGHO2_01_FULL_48_17]